MGAPKFNQFWKLRSKHGRDKIFETPEMLWQTCCSYFDEIGSMTLGEQNWVGKDGNEVTKNHPIPFTKSGLCTYLDITERTWDNYRSDESHKDFFPIVARIEQIIRTQKFSYAATGFFNPNIIARDLGLTDKKDHSSSDGSMSPKPTIVNTSDKKLDLDHLTDGQ